MRRLEKIKQLSIEHHCSVASVVFLEVDVFPVIGGRTLSQIEDSMSGADVSIPADVITDLLGY